jgi:two-component system, cell cycle sensor histidine kinase and response regulator CckA
LSVDHGDGVYETVFKRSTMPLWVVDAETHAFLAVNDAVVDKYGFSREELLAMRVGDLHCDDEPLPSRASHRAYVPGPRPGVTVDGPYRHRTRDNGRIEVRIETTRIAFQGRPALLSTVIDETHRRLLEERLEETDRLWRALVDSSPDIVLLVDAEGTVLFVNRVGPPFERSAIVGNKIWEFASGAGEARIRPVLRKLVETREALRYEAEGPHIPNAPPTWYEVCAMPVVVDGTVDRILWIATDVTARKSLEAQLRQSQKLEAIGLLAGGVAHDFNNLLAIIMGFSEASLRKLPLGHPVAEPLDEVLGAARRGGELTRKLLAFSRKQVLRPSPVEVHTAVQELTRLLARVLGADIDLRVAREGGPLVVQADPVQLEQVLLNLSTNARQAMPSGGRLVLRTRAVALDAGFAQCHPWSRAGSFAEITVSDTGIGMDEATRLRLFEPFFTTKPEGTGLGLATAYGIIQQHGGLVNVESSPGAGATFRVYLPLIDGEKAAQGAQPRVDAPEPRGTETILVAEDEPSLRRLVSTMLRDRGYRVVEAADGLDAVQRYAAGPTEIALVVLDVVLPRLDARQVYEQMQLLRPDVKVLFTTGYAPESTRLGTLLDQKGIALLEKPFMPSVLAAKIRTMIDAK